jgi:hypothetical protein
MEFDSIFLSVHEHIEDDPIYGRATQSGRTSTMQMSMRRFTRLTNAFSKKYAKATATSWRSTSSSHLFAVSGRTRSEA